MAACWTTDSGAGETEPEGGAQGSEQNGAGGGGDERAQHAVVALPLRQLPVPQSGVSSKASCASAGVAGPEVPCGA